MTCLPSGNLTRTNENEALIGIPETTKLAMVSMEPVLVMTLCNKENVGIPI